MLVHSVTYSKCGIIGASCFYKEEHQSSVRTSCHFLPAHADLHELNRDKKVHLQTKGFRYPIILVRAIEKTTGVMAVGGDLQDLPVSNSYETAMEALSSLITRQKRSDRTPVSGKYEKLDRMRMYLKILDLEERVAGLKIIHVAGTKGKGSTCTFCEAILRNCGFRTGLFTSPHLIDVRERFRIDGLDISEDKFLLYFWDCWNRLKEHVTEDLPMPPLFQFLTILAFTIFVNEQVDVSIIEVGIGGTNDSTNVIKEPVVCGITPLGMDHMETLGDTLGQIASHKAGIFKPQVPAFTVPQLSEAMAVIEEKAHQLMVPLEVVPPLDYEKLAGIKLSLSGDHQLTNAALAVSLCKCWLQRTGNWEKLYKHDKHESSLPQAFLLGLSDAHLSGRAQIVSNSPKSYSSSEVAETPFGDLVFYLDGAHSPESMEVCAKWFSGTVDGKPESPIIFSSSPDVERMKGVGGNGSTRCEWNNAVDADKISKKILLFNCMDLRDPQILLPRLVTTCAASGTYFSKAIFVPSMSTYNKVTSGASNIPSDIPSRDLSWQFRLQRLWEKLIHGIGETSFGIKFADNNLELANALLHTEVDASLDNSTKTDFAESLPPREFLYEDTSRCSPADGRLACSAVIPSLPLTIKWLRDCVKENPTLRLHVLVTGSLHLVGDVLKLLKR